MIFNISFYQIFTAFTFSPHAFFCLSERSPGFLHHLDTLSSPPPLILIPFVHYPCFDLFSTISSVRATIFMQHYCILSRILFSIYLFKNKQKYTTLPPTPPLKYTPTPFTPTHHICNQNKILTPFLPLLLFLQRYNTTALLLAPEKGHTETVKALLTVPGIDVNHAGVSIRRVLGQY